MLKKGFSFAKRQSPLMLAVVYADSNTLCKLLCSKQWKEQVVGFYDQKQIWLDQLTTKNKLNEKNHI